MNASRTCGQRLQPRHRPGQAHWRPQHGSLTVLAASSSPSPGPLSSQLPTEHSSLHSQPNLADTLPPCKGTKPYVHQTTRQPGSKPSAPKLPRQLHPVHHQVLGDIRSKQLLNKGEHILVHVSGDLAGLVLAKVLLDLSGAWDWHITVALDARLSASSATSQQADDASLHSAYQMLTSWGLTCVVCQQGTAADMLPLTAHTDTPVSCASPGHIHSAPGPRYPDVLSAAAHHCCTAIAIATTATDCAVQLLSRMLRPPQQTEATPCHHMGLHVPAFTTPPPQGDGQSHGAADALRHTGTRPVHRSNHNYLPTRPQSHIEVSHGGPRVVRPLLRVSDIQLQAFAAAQHQLAASAWPQPASPPASTLTSSDAVFITRRVLPYLRTHFNPSIDQVLTRAAMILYDNEAAAVSTRLLSQAQQPSSIHTSQAQQPSSTYTSHSLTAPRDGNDSLLLQPLDAQLPLPATCTAATTASAGGDGGGQQPDKCVAAVRQCLLHQVIRVQSRLKHVRRVLVAVSGGQDSLALLRLLLDVQPQLGWEVVVGHCDHRWRADSAANAQHVQQLCEAWGASCLVQTVSDPSLVRNEASARRWRYGALLTMARQSGCQAVLTGHTRTDVVETQLMNLLRGAGPAGLLSLKSVRRLGAASGLCRWRRRVRRQRSHGGRVCQKQQLVLRSQAWNVGVADVGPSRSRCMASMGRLMHRGWLRRIKGMIWTVRPLVHVSRADTGVVCDELGLPVWLDSTNMDASIARRNKIRLQLMPLLHQQFGTAVEGALSSNARHVAHMAGVLTHLASTCFKQVVIHPGLGRVRDCLRAGGQLTGDARSGTCVWVHKQALEAHALCCLDLALQRLVVMQLLQGVPGLRSRVTFDCVEEVLQLLGAPNGTRTSTLLSIPLSTLLGPHIKHSKATGPLTAVLEGTAIRVQCLYCA